MTQQISCLILQWDLIKLKFKHITHAKVIVYSDESVRVTFGKLNAAGHYQPDRKVRQTVTPTPGTSRIIFDGVGWDWKYVKSFVEAAAVAAWQDWGE